MCKACEMHDGPEADRPLCDDEVQAPEQLVDAVTAS
jgi:hypothetical protein